MNDPRQTTRPDDDPRFRGPGSDEPWDPLDEDSYGPPPPPRRPGAPDLSPIFVLLDAVVRGVPRDVRDQFRSVVREVLLTLRTLIDWYLERLDAGPPEARIEDIPID